MTGYKSRGDPVTVQENPPCPCDRIVTPVLAVTIASMRVTTPWGGRERGERERGRERGARERGRERGRKAWERDRGREGEGENKGEAERELGGGGCEGDDDFLILLPVLFVFF